MGLFYTNVILYNTQQHPIADFLGKQGRLAYVSPTQGGYTVVYDKETENQDIKILKNLSELLTKKFECTALASLVHDSDIYMYWLYKNGKLLDSYNSLPGYFDTDINQPPPSGGDSQILCKVFEKADAALEVQKIFELVEQGNLYNDLDEFLQAEDIHSALIKALGMPAFGACLGYYKIENSGFPKSLQRDNLLKTYNIKPKWFWKR